MCVGGYQYLGQLYMAEALVQLGRIPEALQYLNPEAVGDITVTLNSTGDCNCISVVCGLCELWSFVW